jgi:HEAT repeat protein
MSIMGKRLSVEERLSSIRRLRELQQSTEVTAELRSALRDKSNLIVAAAAAVAGDQKRAELAPELEAAFERFLVDPLKNDKLCRAKIAVVQALDKLEHERPDSFLRAAGHVQLEPVWGGQEDTAAPLRAAAILGLARIDYRDLLTLLVDALTDPQKEVRIAAAQALGAHASDAAVLLLRFKARTGDAEPEVITECLCSLLACAPKESLQFVAQFLRAEDSAVREAAILALGRSRLAEAFDLLKACWEEHPIGDDELICLAMAMLRLPAANEFLLALVARGQGAASSAALSALAMHRYHPGLRTQIAEAVAKSGSRILHESFERHCGKME